MHLSSLTPSQHGQFEMFEAASAESRDAQALRPIRRRRARLRHDPQIALLPLNDYEWSEQAIFMLLEKYLRRRLRLLQDGRSEEWRRQKIINWVAAPIVPWQVACRRPLSFQACCYVWPADPELSREKILQRVAPERLRDLE
jgi:hypothetical protein